ncbi:MAG: hypothetical protein V4578_11280, partial [Pseudomonadota bacterium]
MTKRTTPAATPATTQPAALRFTLPLPAGYRLDDVLTFHRRDAESVAEQVTPQRLRKGMLLDGVPVVLDIALNMAYDKAY